MFRFTIRDLLWMTVVAGMGVFILKDSIFRPRIALDGYCPVSVVQDWKWVRGKSDISAVYGGQCYLFASTIQREIFLAQPARYEIKASGNDIVRLNEENRFSVGTRTHGVIEADGIYVFDSEETLAKFEKSPSKYKAK